MKAEQENKFDLFSEALATAAEAADQFARGLNTEVILSNLDLNTRALVKCYCAVHAARHTENLSYVTATSLRVGEEILLGLVSGDNERDILGEIGFDLEHGKDILRLTETSSTLWSLHERRQSETELYYSFRINFEH